MKSNLKIVDVTPEMQRRIDPLGKGIRHLRAMRTGNPVPTPAFLRGKTREEWLDLARDLYSPLEHTRYQKLFDDEQHAESKYGAQGATVDLQVLKDKARLFYETPDHPVAHPLLCRARDFLLSRIKSKIDEVGYPQIFPVKHKPTAGGLPYCYPKTSFIAETAGMANWRHPVEDLPGQRNMRQAPRLIHMDSVANVRYIEKPLSAVRNWLKNAFPEWFSAWINPRDVLLPRFTTLLAFPSCKSTSFDYKHCDERFSWAVVAEYILPVYEVLLPPAEFMHFASFVEEAFQQPIYFGNELWTGLHNLFSGQGFTNDFETIWDIILLIALILDRIDVTFDWLSPRTFLAANGDDFILCDTTKRFLPESLVETAAELCDCVSMILSKEKCETGDSTIHFLRRRYGPRYPTGLTPNGDYVYFGAYPLVLCMNSIVNPEYQSETPQEAWTALCQRCDNLLGHPMYVPFVELLARELKTSGYDYPGFIPRYEDWWTELYGDPWTPEASRTVKEFRRLGLIP